MFKKSLAGIMVFFLTACSLQDVPFMKGDSSSSDGALSALVASMPEKSLFFAFNQTPSLDALLSDSAKTIEKIIKELKSDPIFAGLDLTEMTEAYTSYVKDGELLLFEKLSLFVALKPGIEIDMKNPEEVVKDICVSISVVSQHEMFDDLAKNATLMAESALSEYADSSVSRSSGKLELSSGCTGVAVPDFTAYAEHDLLFAEKQFVSAIKTLSEEIEIDSEVDTSTIKKIQQKLESALEKLNFNKVRMGTLGQVMSVKLSDKGYHFERFEQLVSAELQTLRYDFWNGKAQSEMFYLNESADFEADVSKEGKNAVYLSFKYENLDWTHLVSLLEKQGLGGIMTMSIGAGLAASFATLSGYMEAAKGAERQAVVRNAATIMKTARAIDSVGSFAEDVNGDGQFNAKDIERVLMDAAGYSIPETDGGKCFFYGYGGDENDEFVVLIGKSKGKQSGYRNRYLYIDGTSSLEQRVSAAVKQDFNCTAPKMSDVSWINLSQGGGSKVMDLSSRSGGLININDNPTAISITSSRDNLERQASVRNAGTIMKVAMAVASIESFKEDVDGNGRFDAKDIKRVLKSEGAYSLPNVEGDQCYFYMVSNTNDNEFAVFVGSEDQSVSVDGTPKMVAAAKKLFNGKPLNCALPSIPGGTVLNLSQ